MRLYSPHILKSIVLQSTKQFLQTHPRSPIPNSFRHKAPKELLGITHSAAHINRGRRLRIREQARLCWEMRFHTRWLLHEKSRPSYTLDRYKQMNLCSSHSNKERGSFIQD